jgi:hypothetical protein
MTKETEATEKPCFNVGNKAIHGAHSEGFDKHYLDSESLEGEAGAR